MIKVSFDNPDVQINNVQGYRITARLNPRDGFQNEFYVYIASVFAASNPLKPVTFGEIAGPRPGRLEIAGQRRAYSFDPASLVRVHAGATRRERFQILEFRVDFSQDGQPEVDIENDDPVTLQKLFTLQDDYKISVDGGEAEQLLHFAGLQSEGGDQIYRFSALRNRTNSWLASMLRWHEAIRSEDDAGHEIEVEFSQGEFNLNRETVNLLYFDESYGVCQGWDGLSLHEVANPHLRGLQSGGIGARLPVWSYDLDKLMEHEAQAQTQYEVPDVRRAVETATVLFNQGFNHRLNVV